MDLRRNRKRCIKFREVLETQEYSLQDTKERRQREAQSKRRYVLLTSELQLVHTIYMTLFVTTSLSKLHRKRQSEQTGKTTSWVSDLAQMTYKPWRHLYNSTPAVITGISFPEMITKHHSDQAKHVKPKTILPCWKLLNNTSGSLCPQLHHKRALSLSLLKTSSFSKV